MALIMATRTLPIGLLAAVLAALLCGACSSSATTKPDGGGGDGGGDHPTSSNLTGTIAPGASPPCLTQPLLLVSGQAQCTVVQHRLATGGVIDSALPSCDIGQAPCWSLITSPTTCPSGGLTFMFEPDPTEQTPDPSTLSYDYSCVPAN